MHELDDVCVDTAEQQRQGAAASISPFVCFPASKMELPASQNSIEYRVLFFLKKKMMKYKSQYSSRWSKCFL